MHVAENASRPSPRVVLYTRRDCHLCDEARKLLQQHKIEPVLVDIDSDPDLQRRFGNFVPVVEINGRIRFRGRIEPVLLRRILGNSNSGQQ